ncbi:MAG TPA: hypothetical protein PLV52_04685, partial [Candidatus Omnitrophota bacterium]|nr:hypothetical protein [Candidatus Omnitrophota bacterium]
MPAENRKSTKDILLLIFFMIIIAIVILSALSEYRSYKKSFMKNIEKDMASIASLKSMEISQYIRERIGDGNMLFRREAFYNSVKKMREDPSDKENEQYLSKWLDRYGTHYQYYNAFILDTKGSVLLSTPKDQEYAPSEVSTQLPEILRLGEVRLINFYRDDNDGRIYIGVAIPILSENVDNPALGALILTIDPEKYLYPFIKKWPVESQTAET